MHEMGASTYLSSLGCEVTIKQARNVDAKPSGTFFIRYYLSAGDNRRVQLDTQEISSTNYSDLPWNQSFSLHCSCDQDSLSSLSTRLKQQSVVFELRFRSSKVPVIFGKRSKSQLLGRAEVPWEGVFESKNMEMEKWVTMVMVARNGGGGGCGDSKGPPSLLVQMKIRGLKMADLVENKRRKVKEVMNKCGGRCCEEFCGTCEEDYYHVFALAAAFDTSL